MTEMTEVEACHRLSYKVLSLRYTVNIGELEHFERNQIPQTIIYIYRIVHEECGECMWEV